MKNQTGRGHVLPILSLLLVLVILLCSSGCSRAEGTVSENDSLVSMFRDRMTETLSAPDGENVYWVPSGSVYHTTPDCRFIAGKDGIVCSSAAESGKPSACSACAGDTDVSADTTDDIATSADTTDDTAASADTSWEESSEISEDPTEFSSADETETSSELPDTAEAVTQAPMTEAVTAPAPSDTADPSDGQTVYWTSGGKVWHIDRGCPSLANSDSVLSGTAEESGKDRACKRCG